MSTHTRTLAVVVLAVMGVSMSLSVADAQLVIHSWAGPRERHQPTSRWVVRGDDGSESVDRYQSGYDAGHRIGYSEGYVTGMQVGTTDGTDVGTTEGWDDGWVAGYEPAYEQSYATSYPLAHEAGWLERYPEAFQSGYADGYDKYLEDSGGSHLSGGILTWRGVTDLGDIDVIAWDGGFVRLSPQTFSDGYRDGYHVGLEEGDRDGYAIGYETAYQFAYDETYPQAEIAGAENGERIGTEDGTREGRSQGQGDADSSGYASGYDYGYALGDLELWLADQDEHTATAYATFLNPQPRSSLNFAVVGNTVSVVPEPASLTALLVGIMAVALRRRAGV